MDLKSHLSSLGVVDDYDVIIAGDGSGSTWGRGIGWGAILIDRRQDIRRLLWGAMNAGTVQTSELMPAVHALRYHFHLLLGGKMKGPVTVLILSDSRYTVQCGRKELKRTVHRDLWAAVDFFVSLGYDLTWKWVRDTDTDLVMMADEISKEANALLSNLTSGLKHSEKIYDLFPEFSDIREVKVCECCGTSLARNEICHFCVNDEITLLKEILDTLIIAFPEDTVLTQVELHDTLKTIAESYQHSEYIDTTCKYIEDTTLMNESDVGTVRPTIMAMKNLILEARHV